MSDKEEVGAVDVFPYLQQLYERGGSDLFFSVGAPAHMKLEGISQALNQPIHACIGHSAGALTLMASRRRGLSASSDRGDRDIAGIGDERPCGLGRDLAPSRLGDRRSAER